MFVQEFAKLSSKKTSRKYQKFCVTCVCLGNPLIVVSLQWRHNECDGISNHCLLNRWFRHRSKKTSKLCVTGLCTGNSPVTGEFPAQMASNAENWWRHHISLTKGQHNDAMIWECYPHSWPFIRNIHCWAVDSPHKGPVRRKAFHFHSILMLHYILTNSK